MACHGSTKCSPYELVYGHAAVLPWEIRTGPWRIESQENLIASDYKVLMMDDLEDLNCHRLCTLENIEADKLRIAKYYDKKVKAKQFHEGELVWKLILSIGTKDSAYGKWLPNWEGPYRITRCVPGNDYFYDMLEGEEFNRALNGKHFKKYYPSIWVDA
jgi:hypothetical protein